MPTSHIRAVWRALHDPGTLAVLIVALVYAASLALDRVASSYPPTATCTASATSQSLSDWAGYTIAAGGLIALVAAVAIRSKRWWFVGLLVAVPVLVYIGFAATLFPGANCQPHG